MVVGTSNIDTHSNHIYNIQTKIKHSIHIELKFPNSIDHEATVEDKPG